MDKCFICRTTPKHLFRDCVDSTCSCPCVQEIYSKPKNLFAEEVQPDSPKFLKINNVEIKNLPDLAKEVSKFNRVNRNEWLPKRKDRRFTSKRKDIEFN